MNAEHLEIRPVRGPLNATVRVPGSKSYTNRALLLAALADGTSTIRNALSSDDTHYMAQTLNQLGIPVRSERVIASPNAITGALQGGFVVEGKGGQIPAASANLFVGNAGTAMRFLTAFAALGHGRYEIDGVERMRERPIEDLLDGLRQLGCDAQAKLGNGCPPVVIAAHGLRGGIARVHGNLSSQFFSALLMVAPYAAQDVEIQVVGDLVSKPYVDMTIGSMRDFGVHVENRAYQSLRVTVWQRYTARDYYVEGDASAASYFFAAAAIVGGKVRVEGIDRHSLQGDIGFLGVLEQMGCAVRSGDNWAEVEGGKLRGVDVDMNAMSDVAQTLAAVAVFADGKTRIRNIAHVRGKETDRIAATATELRKLSARVTEFPDGLEIAPCAPQPAEIATYDDHRMAMSFALIGLRTPGIRIQNPGCVSKTFPNFFDELARLRH